MTSNGTNGFHSGETLQWKIGLLNWENKYLTAETFGFKINASGSALKKKQLWVLEHDSRDEDIVYLRSHLNRYVSTDKFGNVKCESEEKGADEKFCIKYNSDGSGRWAIKSYTHNYFFGGSADNIKCYDLKTGPKNQEWWTVHLAIHPQVNLRNVNRKRYARCKDDQIQCDENIPWGQDALITIVFLDTKYALKTYDNRYLHREGKLELNPSKDTLFTLELKSGQNPGIAFKDCAGKYLTAVGQNATVQGRNKTVSKDELFTLEDSHPQAFITAHNGKKVSIRQGIDATANQDDLTDMETFQIEYDKGTKKWRIRTVDDKYFSMESQSYGIQATARTPTPNTLFDIENNDDGSISIKASNDRYIMARQNGSLYAVSGSSGNTECFFLNIINRPLLVLKCEFGFVGFKSSGNPRIECNKSSGETFHMEFRDGKNAVYYIKGPNEKYWSVAEDGMVNADSDQPQAFSVQLTNQSRFKLRAADGRYIKGEQNGIFQAKSTDPKDGTDWEY